MGKNNAKLQRLKKIVKNECRDRQLLEVSSWKHVHYQANFSVNEQECISCTLLVRNQTEA
jgi:hypothetical protein